MLAGMMPQHFVIGLEKGYHLKLNGKLLVEVISKIDSILGEISFFQVISIGDFLLFNCCDFFKVKIKAVRA